MPELPEVETIRRQILRPVKGRVITTAEVFDLMAIEPASESGFRQRLEGRAIKDLRRRGKYLLFELESGDTLVIHLRMTGRLMHVPEPAGVTGMRHLRFLLRLDDGTTLSFQDIRRFGRAFILSREESRTYWQKLGVEPLSPSFNPVKLESLSSGRKRPLKSFLLDQHLIAGIGNIYADESLYRAGISPLRSAGEISAREADDLCAAIKKTLRAAIKLKGSSIDSYRTARGERGGYQDNFLVHTRQGEPCPACGTPIEKTRVAGRSTYFCPRCQK